MAKAIASSAIDVELLGYYLGNLVGPEIHAFKQTTGGCAIVGELDSASHFCDIAGGELTVFDGLREAKSYVLAQLERVSGRRTWPGGKERQVSEDRDLGQGGMKAERLGGVASVKSGRHFGDKMPGDGVQQAVAGAEALHQGRGRKS